MRVHPIELKQEFTSSNINVLKSENDQNEHTISLKKSSRSIAPSESIINVYGEFQDQKKKFYEYIEKIKDTRLVENLGSLMSKHRKQECIDEFSVIFQQTLDIFTWIGNLFKQVNFDNDASSQIGEEYISDLIMKDLKGICECFQELIETSSLRYLNMVSEIHELDIKDINLQFPIQLWYGEMEEMILKNRPNRKFCSMSTCFDKDMHSSGVQVRKGADSQYGFNKKKKKKGFIESLCSCFYNKKNQSQVGTISNK